MEIQDQIQHINSFEKRSWAIKKISIERWGEFSPCPIRFVVNPYMSCSFRCPYCYVWSDKGGVSTKPGFRKALKHDIKRAVDLGLNKFLIEISPSTDPFQYIEEEKKETLFAVEELLKNNFRVLFVTKNPGMLLKKDYVGLLKNKDIYVDVTLTSLKEGKDPDYFLNNNGPKAEEKLDAIKGILKQGKNVRVKIEPVVPTFENIRGQTAGDLEGLVERLSQIGVKMIMSKTLRLNNYMPEDVVKSYLSFYKKNGKLISNNYILDSKIRRKMLDPIYKKCREFGITFSPCYDMDVFKKDKYVSFCDVSDEVDARISELYNNARVAE